MRIAIVGTAGRKEDGRKMNATVYFKMVLHAISFIQANFGRTDEITLVSGGAAWADHIAVSLFLSDLEWAGLELHLPAPFVNSKFQEKGFRSPGSVSNFYHATFSKAMGGGAYQTRRSLQRALDAGATSTIGGDFKSRNLLVGDVDVLMAYTWGSGDIPKPGGTLHTWEHSRAEKFHFPIQSL